MSLHRHLLPLVWAAAALAPFTTSWAALPDAPREDITFIAEHLGEAAQDMRYFVLPWPAEPLEPGRWVNQLSLGRGEAEAEILEVSGELVSGQTFYAWSKRNGLALQAFYDGFDIGGGGEQVLRASFFAAVPLDLPERIAVTQARGTVRHYGVGASWLRELSAEPKRGWCLNVGALVERLELVGFAMDYRLLSGRDAGAAGVLDHSTRATFLTPFVGVLRRLPLGGSWALTPHVAAGVPLPPADFHGRLTGPGFERSSRDPAGKPGKIGDGFLALGAGLLHSPSGLELSLGGALAYPLFEKTTHDGVDRSLLLVLSWRLP